MTDPRWSAITVCQQRLYLVGQCFESEVRLRFAARHGDFLRLSSHVLLPRGHGVLSWRDVFDRKRPVGTRKGVVRGSHHRKITVHPGMYIAFHGNEFGLFPLGVNRWRPRGLR